MADLTFEIDAQNDASSELQAVGRDVEDLGKKTEDTGNKVEGAGKKSDEMGKSLGNMKTQALAAAAGVAAVAAATTSAVKAYAEQENVERKLQFAIRTTTATQEEANAAFQKFVSMAAENQETTLFGDEDQLEAAQRLLIATQDVTRAQEGLNIAADLATISGGNLVSVAEKLGQVYNGNVAPLQRFGILTKDQITDLNKVEDVSQRVAIAMEAVREKTSGARTEISQTAQTLAQLENDGGDAEQAMGKMALAAANLGLTIVGNTQDMEEGTSTLTHYANAWNAFADDLNDIAQAWDEVSLSEAFAPTSNSAFFSIFDQMEDAMARSRADAERTNRAMEGITSELDKQVKAFERLSRLGSGSSERTTPSLPMTREQYDNLKKSTDEIEAQNKARWEEIKAERERNAIAERELAILEESSDLTRAQLVYELELERIRQADLTTAERKLQIRRAELGLAEDIARIEMQGFTPSTQIPEDEALIATIDSGQFQPTGIRGGTPSDVAAGMQGADAETRAETMGQGNAIAAGISSGFGEASSTVSSLNEELGKTIGLLGESASGGAKLATSLTALAETQWNFEEATEATTQAFSAMSQIGAAAAGAMGDSVREQAGIRALFELAAAAGATALGIMFPANPAFFAAAANHGIAAATYGLVAGGVISGGASASSGAAAGSGAAATGVSQFDVQAEREATAAAISDAITQANQAQSIVFNLDMGNNNVLMRDSPSYARDVFDQFQQGAAQII